MSSSKMVVGDNIILKGLVKKVFFHNQSNGFAIFSLSDIKLGINTIVKGVYNGDLHDKSGNEVEITGTVIKDPKFGIQVSASSIKEMLPINVFSIVKYLDGIGISGVGKVIAGRIVDMFGDKTFDVIDKNPDLLSTVHGIGKKRAEEICKATGKIRAERDAVMYLSDIGLSSSQGFHAIEEFGSDNVVNMIKENPYVLCKVFGIGFDKIDGIALNVIKIPKDHPSRIEAVIVNHIEKETSFGSVAIKYPFNIRVKYGISSEKVKNRIAEMLKDQILILDKGHVYLEEMYRCEVESAKILFNMSKNKSSFSNIREDDIKAVAETKLGFKLHQAQIDAISKSIKSQVSVITGGPGVGKTTVVEGLISVIESYGVSVCLCAPTGKAAKRLHEDALTIHKLIGIGKDGSVSFDEENKHHGKCFVIDESSMVDIKLLHKFLCAISDDSIVIFVGDVDQLPSVGPGAILRDMINSNVITTSKLTKVFRQAAESSIISNAILVNSKKPIDIDKEKEDFIFIETSSDKETAEELKYYIQTQLECGVDVIDDIQILSPMRKGEVGITELNNFLPEMLNKNKQYTIGSLSVAINDKVMQLANNYDKNVFNGGIGTVVDFVMDEYGHPKSLIVMFDDKLVSYDKKEVDELTLGYSYSVHKSQGSQYPEIVIPISKEHVFMWDKNLLYTAITRAEKTVVLIGDKKVLNALVLKDKSNDRVTFLNERLNDEYTMNLKREKYLKI